MLFEHLLLDALDQFFFRSGHIVRNDHIENEVRVAIARHHTEVVDRDALVEFFYDLFRLVLKLHEILVFRVDRIHVDDGLTVEFFRQVILDVIDDVVDIEHVLESRNFGVKGDHLSARTVVVNDHIMDAADGLMGHNDLFDLVDEFFGRRCAKERLDGLSRGVDAGVEDEDRKRNTDIRVDRKVGELRGDNGEKYNGCGDHVVSAVDGSRAHRGRIDDLRPFEVVEHHVGFYQKGSDQHRDGKDRAVDRCRVDDALDRGFTELEAHDADQKGNDETRDVLQATVTERMVGVRCFSRETKTDHRDDRRSCVGEVVQSVTDDGDGVRENTHDELSDEKQDVEEDTARTADTSDVAADLRLLRLIDILHQFSDQKRDHGFSLPDFFHVSIHYNRLFGSGSEKAVRIMVVSARFGDTRAFCCKMKGMNFQSRGAIWIDLRKKNWNALPGFRG